jgi:hypothetical protein
MYNFPALSDNFSKTFKHEGLKILVGHNFDPNHWLMADALGELSNFCEFLQLKYITMPQADKATRTGHQT